jgi:hypothetical protein
VTLLLSGLLLGVGRLLCPRGHHQVELRTPGSNGSTVFLSLSLKQQERADLLAYDEAPALILLSAPREHHSANLAI